MPTPPPQHQPSHNNTRSIIVTAALMTAQAVLLALLSASGAHATQVHHCAPPGGESGGIYQMHPCDPAVPSRTFQAADPRSPQQIAQARETQQRHQRLLTEAGRNQGRTGKSRPAKAIALSRHKTGERPFEHLGQQVTPPASPRSARQPSRPADTL